MERAMSKRTVLNDNYKGLVESFSIPAEVVERNGKKFARVGSAVPIHCCTPDEIKEASKKTHHYCGLFSEQLFAPLTELAYVRFDENTAEKVFINRSKRILIVSSDGVLAQWWCAPTFESNNQYIAGTPLVNKDGELLSLVTAKRGNHYAVSCFEGEGGYFETNEPWKLLDTPENYLIYGDRSFVSRESLREYVHQLPPVSVGPDALPIPVVHRGQLPRITLVTRDGSQLSHHRLHGVITADIEYL